VFASEMSRTAGQDAQSLIEPDRCGLTDVRHAPTATKFQSARRRYPNRAQAGGGSGMLPSDGELAVARDEQTKI
jgi:hypothetical protein